jgi:hypothetical protein
VVSLGAAGSAGEGTAGRDKVIVIANFARIAVVARGAGGAGRPSGADIALRTNRLACAANASIVEVSLSTASAAISRVAGGAGGADRSRGAGETEGTNGCAQTAHYAIQVVSSIAGGASRWQVSRCTGATNLTRPSRLAQKTGASYCAVLAVGANCCRARRANYILGSSAVVKSGGARGASISCVSGGADEAGGGQSALPAIGNSRRTARTGEWIGNAGVESG